MNDSQGSLERVADFEDCNRLNYTDFLPNSIQNKLKKIEREKSQSSQ